MLEISDGASHLIRLVWVAANALIDTPILNYISYATLCNAYRFAVELFSTQIRPADMTKLM